MALEPLVLGCRGSQEPIHIGVNKLKAVSFQMEDAIPVLSYKEDGIVLFLSRTGIVGEIDLKTYTVRKDSTSRFRQYGMPYQFIDGLALASFSDNGILIGNKHLMIRDKGSHYSAYKSIPINNDRDLISVTSDGVFLFTNIADVGKDSIGRRLFPVPERLSVIDSVRFLDIVRWDEETFYAAGHCGVVEIRLGKNDTLVTKDPFFEKNKTGVSLLRVDENRILYAYGENGMLYKREKGSSWKSEKGTPGVSHVVVERTNRMEREWRFVFDRPTEVWENRLTERSPYEEKILKASIDDEESTGIQTLNDRIHNYVVDAGDYGIVVARGRYIYVIPKQAILTDSEPAYSACLGKDGKIYIKAGVYGEYSGLFSSAISGEQSKRTVGDDNASVDEWSLTRPSYIRDIPREGKLVGVRRDTVVIQSGNTVQFYPFTSGKMKEHSYERLVSARLDDDGEVLCLTQNAILAYGDTLDFKKARVRTPADYYPQTFIPVVAGENPVLAIATLHAGIVILRRNEEKEWEPVSVDDHGLLVRDSSFYDTAVLMEVSNPNIFICTKKGRVGILSPSSDGWEAKEICDSLPLPIDDIAVDGESFFWINYFRQGWNRLESDGTAARASHLTINGLCPVPDKGVVFACREGVYGSWDREMDPNPVLLPSGWFVFSHNYPVLSRWLLIGGVVFLIVALLIIAIIILGFGRLKREWRIIIPEVGSKAELLKGGTSIEESFFNEAWKAFVSSMDASSKSYVQYLHRVVLSLIRNSDKYDWKWGRAICQRLQDEGALVQRYFQFLSIVEKTYRDKIDIEDSKDNKSVSQSYDYFSATLLQTTLAREELVALCGKSRTNEAQVKSYFMSPFVAHSQDVDYKWFGTFRNLDSHYRRITEFRKGKGRIGMSLKNLVENRRKEHKGVGIVVLSGIWGLSEDRIDYYTDNQSFVITPRTIT